jgi:hypothetical protein
MEMIHVPFNHSFGRSEIDIAEEPKHLKKETIEKPYGY